MPTLVKIWDAQARKVGDRFEGDWVELYSLNATEAIKNDVALCKADEGRKRRYYRENPDSVPDKVDVTEPTREAVAVDIPADWASMEWPQRRKLAVKLGADRNCSSEIANAVIAATLKRRASVEPEPVDPEKEPAS